MDEIESLPCCEAREIGFQLRQRQFGSERGQGIESEHRVIEIAATGAITESTVGAKLRPKEFFDQSGDLDPEHGRGEAGDLQHFETEAHSKKSRPDGKSGRRESNGVDLGGWSLWSVGLKGDLAQRGAPPTRGLG